MGNYSQSLYVTRARAFKSFSEQQQAVKLIGRAIVGNHRRGDLLGSCRVSALTTRQSRVRGLRVGLIYTVFSLLAKYTRFRV